MGSKYWIGKREEEDIDMDFLQKATLHFAIKKLNTCKGVTLETCSFTNEVLYKCVREK